MRHNHLRLFSLLCSLWCILGLFIGGCGDDANEEGGSPPTEVSRNVATVVNRVLDILFGDGSGVTRQGQQRTGTLTTRQEPVEVTIACSRGSVAFNGEADTAGEQSNFVIDGVITFANCDGIAGSVTLESSGTVRDSRITITLRLNNGPLTAEGCAITFEDFAVDTTANTSGETTSPILVNGRLRATCAEGSVVCTPNQIDIENRQAFEARCRET